MTVRKSLAWSFSQEFIQKGVRFAGSIAIARLLTPDEVGVFSIAMAAYFLISTFRDLGVNTYLVREPELTQDKIRTVFGISLAIHWSLALLVVAIRHSLANVYSEPGIADVLLVVALLFLIGPFGGPARALLRRDMRFDVLHHIAAASVMIGTGTSIALAAQDFSYMALAWGMLCGNIVRNGLTLMVRPDHVRLRPGFRHWRQVLGFGGWLTGAGFANTVTVEGNKFIVGGLLTPASVALVERAQQIPRMSRQALFMPVRRVLIPSFSKDIRQGVSIGPSVDTYIAALTGLLWPMSLTLAFLSTPIVLLLFGQAWEVAGQILPFLALAMAIRASLPTPHEILVPHGRVRRLTALQIVQLVYTLLISCFGALHSLELFAIFQVPIALLFLVTNYAATRSFLETTLKHLGHIYAKGAATACLTAAPAFTVVLIYGPNPPVVATLAAVIFALPLWIIALNILSHPLKSELHYGYTSALRAVRRA
jgi:O-antigen/teichoic acid export membrane protein